MDEKIAKFRKTLAERMRESLLTLHAQMCASERELENRLIQTDLQQGEILEVREQPSVDANERVFDVRLVGIDGQTMRYILAINNLIRVITLMRISRLETRELK